MKKIWKRLCAGLLSFVLLFTLVPVSAFAEPKEVTIYFGLWDNYNGDDRLDNGYLFDHPDIVTAPDTLLPVTATEGNTITLPKAVTTDMTEEEAADTTTQPYFYVKNSAGQIIARMVCDEILLLANTQGQEDTVITADTQQPYQYEVPAGWDPDNIGLMIIYSWHRDTDAVYHSVDYEYNIGSADGQLPSDANIYIAGQYPTSEVFPYYGYGSLNDTPAPSSTVAEDADYQVGPEITNSNYGFAGLFARSGSETEGYTYYPFLGWKIEGSEDDRLYQIGDTVTMGDADVTYVAQWGEGISENDPYFTDFSKIKNLEMPLTVRYSDPDYPGGTDAQITQRSTSTSSFNRVNDTRDDPLLLNKDRTVSYRATMNMSRIVAEECLGNQKVTDPDFANFTIHVQIGDNLSVLDEDGTVTFSFTCTFLKPTGEVKFVNADGSSVGSYTANLTQADDTYTFTVPASEFKSNSFEVPVKWIPGSHNAEELRQEIALEVISAQIDSDYTGVVETSGYITGAIDFSKSPANNNSLLNRVTAHLLTTQEWKTALDENGDGSIDVLESIRANEYLSNYAAQNIDLNANSVYAQYRPDAAIQPADLTVYMGGTDGYEGVLNGSNTVTASNSLPEPGFYITLPDEVNAALEAAQVSAEGETADLSNYLRIYTQDGTRSWKLEPYGKTYSGANDRYIYRVVPEAKEQDPVRLHFTDEDGNRFVSDEFDPSEVNGLANHYTMDICSDLVDQDQVILEIKVPRTQAHPDGYTYYCTLRTAPGDLTIRYVTGQQDSVDTDVVEDIASTTDRSKAYAQTQPGTTFTINESQVDVTAAAAPSLLFDDVVTSGNTAGAQDYDVQLKDRAVQTVGVSFANLQYQAKYLDLVDANNGNVWLKASKPVTVYWPYPQGTDKNTTFYLVHFSDLNREMANSEIAGNIAASACEAVEVTNTDYGIAFEADSFSPYVLMWDNSTTAVSTPTPDEHPDIAEGIANGTWGGTPTPTPSAQATVIPQTSDSLPLGMLIVVAVAAAGAVVVLLVLRKRRGR